MAAKTADADHFARESRITGAAASSMNALKPRVRGVRNQSTQGAADGGHR